MDSVSNATVSKASNADPGSVQGTASLLMLKKSLEIQSSAAAQMIATLRVEQPKLSTGGNLGTKVNTFA